MSDDKKREWDFGFSLVDEDFVAPTKAQEIEARTSQLDQTAKEIETRLNDVVSMILPLLNNLMKDPEKPTIYWPNRVEKVREFRDALIKVSGLPLE